MKKTINTSELESQLAGSVFFRKPKPPDSNDSKESSKPKSHKDVRQSAGGTSPPLPTSPSSDSNNRTVTPNERTVTPNGFLERSSVLSELEEGVRETKRDTERYSFEIFTDQIGDIEDLQYRYKKKTGRKLSSSRIIREALDEYLKKAEEAL